MNINIPTNDRLYFYQIIQFMSFFRPFSGLSKRDREVYAVLLYKVYELGLKDLNKANKYLFSTVVRHDMAKDINMSHAAFNNTLTKLRKLGITDKSGICKKYFLGKDKVLTINFIDNGKQ